MNWNEVFPLKTKLILWKDNKGSSKVKLLVNKMWKDNWKEQVLKISALFSLQVF